MVTDVILYEGRDEEIGVVVARLQTQQKRYIDLSASLLKLVR